MKKIISISFVFLFIGNSLFAADTTILTKAVVKLIEKNQSIENKVSNASKIANKASLKADQNRNKINQNKKSLSIFDRKLKNFIKVVQSLSPEQLNFLNRIKLPKNILKNKDNLILITKNLQKIPPSFGSNKNTNNTLEFLTQKKEERP